eukprot:scaffold139_cov324-Prasinococcus_capsulatus_cf.AAC.2
MGQPWKLVPAQVERGYQMPQANLLALLQGNIASDSTVSHVSHGHHVFIIDGSAFQHPPCGQGLVPRRLSVGIRSPQQSSVAFVLTSAG